MMTKILFGATLMRRQFLFLTKITLMGDYYDEMTGVTYARG